LANALRARALALLARREMSRAELRRRLEPLAESPAELDQLLDELARSRLQSDARFTEALVHTRARRFGTSRIAAELRDKGVAPELADTAMVTLRADEEARALAVWRRKYPEPASTAAERARQGRFLAGRGFAADIVRRIIDGRIDDEAAGESGDRTGKDKE
jgi:regulatory protein